MREGFAGTNFRYFANCLVVRESSYQQNRSVRVIREGLYPRNFVKIGKNESLTFLEIQSTSSLVVICFRFVNFVSTFSAFLDENEYFVLANSVNLIGNLN